ncbi:hypothetical protein [Nesterenkonia alkaliphila]|uniref:DUF2092 domain-containing protein n=1 Tax=Nesterenkonia alkaliphila TaxID=1463631 RepID=A0A7K1UHF2_9MICC|nr:hypothetical protein [Nesterenkonia alkaliphila]MVT25903.1 hypothetical protein [Nesterenkonia alkaliphila]GFZ76317.1 hypothetical protein GCM10011359_00200 [Nesterenkonia alkaliphila]
MRRVTFPIAAAAALSLAACGNPFDYTGETPAQPDPDRDSPQAEEIPAFGEIREEVFTSMLAAESVTITGDVEAGDAELDEQFEGLDDDTTGRLAISGALDGTDSEMSFSSGGSSFTQRAVDGQEYFHGEDFAALLVSELDDEVAELVDQEFMEETIGDSWVLFEDAEGAVFSAEEFITTWQNELTGEDVDAMQAESGQRDGQEVWIYTADGGASEFIVAAEGEPYLLSITDEDSHFEFTEWNASPAPEVPENVITLDEIVLAIAAEQGWNPEDLDLDNDEDTEDDTDD